MNRYVTLITLATCLNLGACAHRSTQEAPTPEQVRAFEEVQSAYDAGNYAQVAQQVGLSVDLQSAPSGLHTQALKLQAFSYCLLDDAGRCKLSFDRLLKRYPSFDLAEAERQHPMWGPVFQEAKTNAGKQ